MSRYEVLEAVSVYQLTEVVNQYVSAGWVPSGGICVYGDGEYRTFAQAVYIEAQ